MWSPIDLLMTFAGVGIGTNYSTPLQNNSWAFLVAGSKGYNNYRHQADVSHAYHVMLAEGIPASRIIVMMYDDIAFNPENNMPGVIINNPYGPNVYEGLKIDYRGLDVNARNFMNVLQGKRAAMYGIGSGRVIESDANTNIFVYFADHGGPGMLCFPGEVLFAVHLQETLKKMYDWNQYNKIIMYIEACYSGSMFDNILEENTNVFVMTAAARDESSYGAYCDTGNCLADEFSVRWLELMDSVGKGCFESFFHQYEEIRSLVRKSHVQIYGDFSVGTGGMTPNEASQRSVALNSKDGKFVNSKYIPVYSLKLKIRQSNDTSSQKKAQVALHHLVQGRKMIDQLMDRLVYVATLDQPQFRSKVRNSRLGLNKQMFPCYMQLFAHFRAYCFGQEHEYLIHHYHKLSNICVLQLDTKNLLRRLPSLCFPYKASVRFAIL